jgi:hypothetical protein
MIRTSLLLEHIQLISEIIFFENKKNNYVCFYLTPNQCLRLCYAACLETLKYYSVVVVVEVVVVRVDEYGQLAEFDYLN